MTKRERDDRDLTHGERAFVVAEKVDRKLAGLVGRCTVFCGDVECPGACTKR